MIERVHEHLIGELRQNTRTDTIFIITAILLNLAILGTNSAVGGMDTTTYNPETALTEGTHRLYVETREQDDWEWKAAGSLRINIEYLQSTEPSPVTESSTAGNPWVWKLPRESVNVRYQLDGKDYRGWAVHTETDSKAATQTSIIFILIFVSICINLAVIYGLLKGKKTRLIILGGLIRMYKDQQVDTYYDRSLLANYGVRYYTFISVVVLLGIISIVIPLIVKYL